MSFCSAASPRVDRGLGLRVRTRFKNPFLFKNHIYFKVKRVSSQFTQIKPSLKRHLEPLNMDSLTLQIGKYKKCIINFYTVQLWVQTSPCSQICTRSRSRSSTYCELHELWSQLLFKVVLLNIDMIYCSINRDFKIRWLRTTDYGWTPVFLWLKHWAEYTTSGAKMQS